MIQAGLGQFLRATTEPMTRSSRIWILILVVFGLVALGALLYVDPYSHGGMGRDSLIVGEVNDYPWQRWAAGFDALLLLSGAVSAILWRRRTRLIILTEAAFFALVNIVYFDRDGTARFFSTWNDTILKTVYASILLRVGLLLLVFLTADFSPTIAKRS